VQQGGSMLRAYTKSSSVPAGDALPMVSNVTVDNLTGSAYICAFFGDGFLHNVTRTGTIKNFVWKNSTLAADAGSGLTENVADITFSNYRWITDHSASPFLDIKEGHIDLLSLQNVTVELPSEGIPALIQVGAGQVATLDELSIDGLTFSGIRNRLPQLVLLLPPSYITRIVLKDAQSGYVNVVNNSALAGTITSSSRSVTANR
jgi:hypothetical protein